MDQIPVLTPKISETSSVEFKDGPNFNSLMQKIQNLFILEEPSKNIQHHYKYFNVINPNKIFKINAIINNPLFTHKIKIPKFWTDTINNLPVNR